jgi:hypothetical protein
MRKGKKTAPTVEKKTKKSKGYFVLFIGDDGAVLVYYQGKQVLRRLFAPTYDDKMANSFLDLLGEFASDPIYVLVDVLDQAYVRHTLPPVTALGVNKIIQRRLSRDFAASDLKGAISLGREKNGRKDWNFLLISLSYNGKLKGWLDLFYDLPNRLMGIYLSPVESQMVIISLKNALHKQKITTKDDNQSNEGGKSKKDKKITLSKKTKSEQVVVPKWDILVMHNKTGGFRQVVLRDNKLVFTRMAQYDPNDKPSVMAGNVEQEIKNTIEYLKRLSFSQGSELHIITIIGEEIKNNINPNAFNATSFMLLTPHEAAILLKIEEAVLSADKYTDIFLSCAFLQYKKHCLKLMSETIKQLDKLYQTIILTKIAASLVIFGLIGYSSYSAYDGFMLSSRLNDKKNEIKTVANRLETFKQQSGDFKVDPLKIDSLIKINDLINEPSPFYDELIAGVAQNISKNAQVKTFAWSSGAASLTAVAGNTPPPPTNIATAIEAKLEWQIIVDAKDDKKAKIIWEELQENLKKNMEQFSIIDEGIEGIGNNGDKLTVNFAQKNQPNNALATEKLTAKMKIVPASNNSSSMPTIPIPNITTP